MPPWTLDLLPRQTGRRFIVTGANSGIGWHTALELARAGGEVTLAARDDAKAQAAAERIRAEVPSARLELARLDLASGASIRSFAENQRAHPRPLDVLIHNAGIMAVPRRELSADGHELQFATNVLGPYLLTGLMLPALLLAPAPRVVTVSSAMHRSGGPVPLTDLDSTRRYDPIRAYSKTKLANLLFATELQRRAGSRLLSVAAHPGGARTNLAVGTSLPMRLAVAAFGPFMQSAAMGAEPTLMAATLPDARPGAFYGPSGLFEIRGHPRETRPAAFALDAGAGRALFDALERLTGVHYAWDTRRA